MGPMLGAVRFLEEIKERNIKDPIRITVTLYGSLAFTGKGHSTDKAIILGLLGFKPETLEPKRVDTLIADLSDK